MAETRREKYGARHATLLSIRAPWEPPWKDICRHLIPYRALFDKWKQNRGEKEERYIVNNTPVRAVSSLASAMMSYVTSPGHPWFGLTTVDPELARFKRVKEWLDLAEERVMAMFSDFGWYNALSNGTYLDLGAIGQSVLAHEEDGVGGIRYSPRPIGEWSLATDTNGRVDTCYRDLTRTVRQLVESFGKNVSDTVQKLWDQSKYDATVDIVHAVQPNELFEPGVYGTRGMRFASCWFEKQDDRRDAFLREHGYHDFPFLCPRWLVRPGDVYGRGPGWFARGDMRVLMLHEKRLATMVDKTTDPTMKASEGIMSPTSLPGETVYMPDGTPGIFEPTHEIDPAALVAMERHVQREEWRINETFFVDVLQTFLQDERNERATATEIDARREERMLMFGPVLENLNDELLEPAVNLNVARAIRMDMLPPLPPELDGQEIKVKFLSIMHEAQQLPKLVGIRTFVAEAAQIAQLRGDIVDKLNADVLADELVSITGVRSDVVLSKDEVEAVRRQKAAQAQAQQEGAAALAASQGVRNVKDADPQQLQEFAGSLQPVAAALGGAGQRAA